MLWIEFKSQQEKKNILEAMTRKNPNQTAVRLACDNDNKATILLGQFACNARFNFLI